MKKLIVLALLAVALFGTACGKAENPLPEPATQNTQKEQEEKQEQEQEQEKPDKKIVSPITNGGSFDVGGGY